MFNFLKQIVYIQLKPEIISFYHLESDRTIQDVPWVAIETQANGKKKVVAVGQGARQLQGQPGIELVNGFEHPRSILADFRVAEHTLCYFLREILQSSLFAPSPVVVMHPQAKLEGGLTQIECRALVEACMGAGARKVILWVGEPLNRQQLDTLDFSSAKGQQIRI